MSTAGAGMSPLLNLAAVHDILRACRFAESHEAKGDHLGYGLLYYALAYALKAQLCLCLGSGGGFVPRLMRQAQRDCGIDRTARTVLVDGNMPEAGWGAPDYHDGPTWFTTQYDVQIIKKSTEEALADFAGVEIDYLHIDADHSYKGALADLEGYLPLVKRRGFITMHDSVAGKSPGVWKAIRVAEELELVKALNVTFLAQGVAILVRK